MSYMHDQSILDNGIEISVEKAYQRKSIEFKKISKIISPSKLNSKSSSEPLISFKTITRDSMHKIKPSFNIVVKKSVSKIFVASFTGGGDKL